MVNVLLAIEVVVKDRAFVLSVTVDVEETVKLTVTVIAVPVEGVSVKVVVCVPRVRPLATA